MGLRGPAKRPKSQAARGNPGKRKAATKPKPAKVTAGGANADKPPATLGTVGQAIWKEAVEQLGKRRMLAAGDERLLVLYCAAWERWHKLNAAIAAQGEFLVSEKGGVYAHPAVYLRRQAEDRIVQLSARFGWSPADRARLEVESDQADDSQLAEFIARQNAAAK